MPSFSSQIPWSARSGLSTQGVQLPCSQLPSAMASGVGWQASQRPVLVMPTGNTSYCSAQGLWPRARSQAEADTQLTSCSLETPPKKSATRSLELLFIKKTPFVKLRGPLGHTTSLQLIIITYYAAVG